MDFQETQKTNFFKKLFLWNQKINCTQIDNWYKRHYQKLQDIWNNKRYNDFGIERILRLFICSMQFIFPWLLIKEIFGKYWFYSKKIATETYALLKLLFPIFIIYSGIYNTFILALIIYLLAETLFYLLWFFLLKDIYTGPILYKRTLFFILLNYTEIVFYYAIFYLNNSCLNKTFANKFEAIYFSFVTSTSLWYWDFVPINIMGQFLVTTELLISLIFITLFFSIDLMLKDTTTNS
jgi:voltage-gated potassium channel